MKIVYIFRDPAKKGFSIEEIFKGLVKKMPVDMHVELFYYRQQETLWQNVRRLRSFKGDLYHITGDVNYLALFLPPRKVILTIHDVGHYKNLTGWRKYIYGWFWIKLPMMMSRVTTSVSAHTQQDLTYLFPTFSSLLQVVPNPVPANFQYAPTDFNVQKPRILQVGTGAHKNLPTLFAAITGIPCRLVIIGGVDVILRALLAKNNIDYENFVNLTQEQVYEQYVLCDLVSFVTTHEGFGMPVLEAQAVGRPIITSRVCSLPEVTNGTTASVEDPMDSEVLRSTLLHIIQDPLYRDQLIKAGLENVRRFDVEKIVQAYVKLYKSILG